MVTLAGWAVTVWLVAGLFGLDLFVSSRFPHTVHVREAVIWSLFYLAVGVIFGVALGVLSGWDYGGQYFAGFVVEKSLSLDNLFVFLIIISAFAVPAAQQPLAITVGIAAALALRVVFIAVGVTLLHAFSFMLLILGIALLITAVQLFRHRNQDPSIEHNLLVEAARRVFPLSNRYDGGRLFTRIDRQRVATPMLLVIVAIGSSDLLFALDSIPAVFGVTQSGFIVFAANAFSLLGLRPLLFLVAGLLERFVYLSTGISVILGFIAVKLLLEFGHEHNGHIPEISTPLSLVVILVILATTAIASLAAVRRDPSRRPHAGTVRRPAPPDRVKPPAPPDRAEPPPPERT